MTQISMRHALAGGASLAVLTLAVMTAANLQTIEDFKWRDAREPVGVPPVEQEVAGKPDVSRRADVPADKDATEGLPARKELTDSRGRSRRRRRCKSRCSSPPKSTKSVSSPPHRRLR